jgi:microcystin-dependent protein
LAETQTPNFHWIKPDIGGDASTWGNVLNSTVDAIDSVVFANQQGIVPIGSIQMFGGATAPANWLICDGRSLATTGTYAALFAVFQYAFGGSGANFNLPNLASRFPLGGTPGQAGGEASHTLSVGEMPVHAHGVSDPTHAHNIADPTHAHGVSDPTHAHGVTQSQHTHQIGVVTGGGSGLAAGAGNAFTTTQTGGASANISIQAAATNIGIQGAATGIGIQGAATGIAIQNAGGGAAHNNMPPYVTLNFIVRYQ